jgi:hypothetical protein
MPSTYDERLTIWRLRHLHGIAPKDIHTLFPDIPHSSVKRITSTFTPQTSPPDKSPTKPNRSTVTKHKDNITFEKTDADISRVQSLSDLLSAFDIDMEKWSVEHSTINAWENAMKGEDNQPIITTLYQVKAFLKPHHKHLVQTLIDSMREEIRDGIPKYKKPKKKHKSRPHRRLLEISIPDMHFGKMALEAETGQEYDLQIAGDLFSNSINFLRKAASKPIDRILIPIGNDLFNIDNAFLTTYANTRQDNIHSVKHLFRYTKNIIRDAILECASQAPVDIVIIPGNHDKTLTYFLGEALEDMFWSDKHIMVDNSPTHNKYYQWGKVLLGFTHGNGEKQTQLPIIMANDQPTMWANTQYREWHLGHLHRRKDQVFIPLAHNGGVAVRILPSLTAADVWHKEHGYHMGPRSAEAYLWDSNNGLVATYNFNVLEQS